VRINLEMPDYLRHDVEGLSQVTGISFPIHEMSETLHKIASQRQERFGSQEEVSSLKKGRQAERRDRETWEMVGQGDRNDSESHEAGFLGIAL